MESLEFILILSVFGAVLFWYLQNEGKNANGELGLLALVRDPETKMQRKRAYRPKQRLARRTHEMRDTEATKAAENATPAFREIGEDERMRQKFRRQDEARYRAKDKANRYKQRPNPRDTTTAA